MQLLLTLTADQAALPIAYNHLIHGLIYHLLEEEQELASPLHETPRTRTYKGFTFSRLCGTYTIQGASIIFHGPVHLEIRCVDPQVIRILAARLLTMKQLRLGSAQFDLTTCTWKDEHITQNEADFIVRAPGVVAYITGEDKKTVFYAPDDPRFLPALLRNAERKWQQYHGDPESFSLTIEPLSKPLPRRISTRFKQTYITAWTGAYRLRGNPEVIDMLYQIGLGAKNSEGFGMLMPG